MKKMILQESNEGVIFRIDKIPNTMFNFYVVKKRTYKDQTHLWALCTELASDAGQKYLVIDHIRGTKSQAIKKLEEIIKNS